MFGFAYANPARFVPAWWHWNGLTLSCSDFSKVLGKLEFMRCKQLACTAYFYLGGKKHGGI